MYPILTAAQIREADAYTIANEPIASIDLMERAAAACVEWITKKYHPHSSQKIIIVCGQGNNGGDGLAIARMLSKEKYNVKVFIIKLKEHGSEDFEINLRKLKNTKIEILVDAHPTTENFFEDCTVIIDAIFGTGLTKPVDGIVAEVIHRMNCSGKKIISIDMPSGLFAEGHNVHCNERNTVMAAHTLTFQVPKLSLLLPDSGKFAGEFEILDIGLDKNFIQSLNSKSFLLPEKHISLLPLARKKFEHKGNFGHTLIIAGSKGKAGAAILTAHACLRSGTGLVTVHVPDQLMPILQTALPEAMVSTDKHAECITSHPDLSKYNSIAVGPGIGTADDTANMLKLLIQNTQIPLVLDADALNILAVNKTWLSFLPPNSILTPHPGEFDRLFGKTSTHFERFELQKELSKKHNIIIVLKGAHTCICFPDGTAFFNNTGNPGMATAGSGDVLTGIIAGLYAQTQSTHFSAYAGVFIHGKAGDLAARKMGKNGMIASDIIQFLPQTIRYPHIDLSTQVNPDNESEQ